jgi:hypothetical protein
MLIAHPPSDLRHTINSRQDERSSINASRDQRHENEIRRREEYDRDHGVLARSRATRVESVAGSTSGLTRGRSRRHTTGSPPWDRRHERRQENTCGVSALTPHLRAIQWPPNFKVSNIDKYEPKQDPGAGWSSTQLPLDCRGDGRRNDNVFAHRSKAIRTAVATTSATTLLRRLEQFQSAFHRQLLVSF